MDLQHGRVGLLRGGGLLPGAAADLINGDQDLAGGAGEFLYRGGKLLGGRTHLGGGAADIGGTQQPLGQARQGLGGLMALVQRRALLLHGAPGLGRRAGLVLRRAGNLLGAALRLARGNFRLARRVEHGMRAAHHRAHLAAHGLQHADHRMAALCGQPRQFAGRSNAFGNGADLAADRPGQGLHLARAFFRVLGEGAHLIGHHGEAASMLAGARGLDRRIDRQQIGLVGDIRHGAGDVANIAGLRFQRADDLHRAKLAGGILLHGGHRRIDLPADLDQQLLQLIGLAAGSLGLVARAGEGVAQAGDRGQRFPRRASGLVGGRGNLFEPAAQFLGGGGGLGDAGGQLLGGGADALGSFLPADAGPIERAALQQIGARQLIDRAAGIWLGGVWPGGVWPSDVWCGACSRQSLGAEFCRLYQGHEYLRTTKDARRVYGLQKTSNSGVIRRE